MTTQIYLQLKGLVANFLRELATAFEENRLSKSQQEAIINIFLKFLFGGSGTTPPENPNIDPQPPRPSRERTQNSQGEIPENELLQFLSLGWFIYRNLLRER